MKLKYFHTIDRQPAFFGGVTICYAGRMKHCALVLVDSLKQIKKEQKAHTDWYRKNMPNNQVGKLGWCYVKV